MKIINIDMKSRRINWYRVCLIVLIELILMFGIPQVLAKKEDNTNTDIEKQDVVIRVKATTTDYAMPLYKNQLIVRATVLTDVYPEDPYQREQVLVAYLSILGEEENIDTWLRIMRDETCYQCGYDNPNLYSKDIVSYGGYATGIFQILPTTWNDCGCGDMNSWMEQVICAVTIKNKYGFTAWNTY